MAKNIFATGNTKIGAKTLSFSLPRLVTCDPSLWCLEHCYASYGHFQFKANQALYERNLLLSKTPEFVDDSIKELKKRKPKNLRIHVVGDFYNAAYIDKWHTIIASLPEIQFKAFTRAKNYLKELQELDKLKNLSLHFSIDESSPLSLLETVYGRLKLANVENSRFDLLTSVKCLSGCRACDYACWVKSENVTLDKRGKIGSRRRKICK